MSNKSARRPKDKLSELDRDAWIASALMAAAKKLVAPRDDDRKAIGVMPGRDKSRFV